MKEAEFDYQWKNLPDIGLAFTEDRVREFLEHVQLPPSFFKGALCLDAGCGSGRFSYAMQQLGAIVDSIDISEEGVKKCRETNPYARVCDIRTLPPTRLYQFVLCWGVLHHLENPREGFERVAWQVGRGGVLHVMIYRKEILELPQYTEPRQDWVKLTQEEKLLRIKGIAKKCQEGVHGWWDALNPTFRWGFLPYEVEEWFKREGFTNIRLVHKTHIQMQGKYKARD